MASDFCCDVDFACCCETDDEKLKRLEREIGEVRKSIAEKKNPPPTVHPDGITAGGDKAFVVCRVDHHLDAIDEARRYAHLPEVGERHNGLIIDRISASPIGPNLYRVIVHYKPKTSGEIAAEKYVKFNADISQLYIAHPNGSSSDYYYIEDTIDILEDRQDLIDNLAAILDAERRKIADALCEKVETYCDLSNRSVMMRAAQMVRDGTC